jgi:WbqC-like protein family
MSGSLAMHQPNYVPWLGYFHKLASCDTFVYLDAVQFPRGRSFAARNRIKTPSSVTWLTMPVSKPHGSEGRVSYAEVTFGDEGWAAKHLRTVEMSYGRAPYFDEVFPLYEAGLSGATPLDVNLALLESFAGYIGITSRRVRLSEVLPSFGQKNELIIDLCQVLDADVYVSGTGAGREYGDEELLAHHGVALRFDEFSPPEYPQLWGDFEAGLSILDVLCNCGAEGCRKLLGDVSSIAAASEA